MKNIKANNLFILLFLIFISLGLPDSLLSTTWPEISNELSVNIGLISTISLITSFFSMLSSNNTHKLNNKLNSNNVIIISMCLCLSGITIIVLFKSLIAIVLASALLGLGAGSIDSNVNLIGSQNLSIGKFNLLHASWGIGITATALITSISYHFNLGTWFVYYVLIAFFIVLIVYSNSRKEQLVIKEDITTSSKPEKKKYNISDYIGVGLYFCYGVEFVIGLFLASYLTTIISLSSSEAAFIVACYWAGLMISRVIMTKLLELVNPVKLLKVHGCLLIVFAFTIQSTNLYVLAISFIAIGYLFGPIYPTFMHFTDVVHPNNASYFISKQLSGYYACVVIMQVLIGVISIYHGLAFYIYIVSALIFLLIACMLIYINKYKQQLSA